MAKVRLLSAEVANKIAAGEVVERPASAVRELLENALDAGATQVRVEIRGGGLELVRVADDGCGMEADDCLLALERHATSKIAHADDLFRISTLGFRGEALPSLAAVSRLSIISRRREDEAATCVRVEGGEVLEVRPCGRAPGTTVEVEALFFNTPARRKFLSAPPREAALVSELVGRYALAHPQVHFRLESAGREVLNLPAAPGRRQRLAACLGREAAAGLMAAQGALVSGISLEAYLAPPELSRTTTRHAYLFLSGRPIRDRLLFHALMRAYEGLLTPGRYPLALLFLSAEPSAVDVNVHPAKAEVRFRDQRRLADALARVLRDALERHARRSAGTGERGSGVHTYVLEAESPSPEVAVPQAAFAGLSAAEPQPSAPQPASAESAGPQLAWAAPRPEPSAPGEAAPAQEGDMVLLGQFQASYLICQQGAELVIIDQHAAHERVLYEELAAATGTEQPARQELLFPAVVELDALQVRVLSAHAEELAAAGLVAEPFGERSAVVRALPQALAREEPATLLCDALDRLGEGKGSELASRRHALLSLLACKGAVKAGEPLSPARARALLARIGSLKVPYCPHGRPIMRRIPAAELARLFRR